MILLDLRLMATALLIGLIVLLLVALWADRRWRGSAMAESPEALLRLLADAPVGALWLDGSRYRFANGAARRWFGLTGVSARLPAAPWASLLAEDRVAARGAGAATRTLQTAGERWVAWWVTPWGDGDLVLIQEVTAHHRAEQESHLLINELAHELRTPLATLQTYTELLRLPTLGRAQRAQSLHLMAVEQQRMARLVQGVAALGRLSASSTVERRPVSLAALLEGIVAQLQPRAGDRLTLHVEGVLPTVIGDSDRLRQLFINLVDNALKYSDADSPITISLTPGEDGVACAICDAGPGIPEEHLPKLTRRFYRIGGADVAGSGLGLAVAVEILSQHDSALAIESHTDGPQRGTCVRFTLPGMTP